MWWLVAMACLTQASRISEELNRRPQDVNPEFHLNVSQMIRYEGYPSEDHEVLTDDGYYLIINRIPRGKNNLDFRGPKPVVLLQHGLLEDASHWIWNTPDKSLGFMLADAGYDVWLGNNRGTRWSKRHQKFSIDQEEFWDFSFHEMAMYDLPAMIHFILTKTGQKELYYIGHSQGSTIGFIAFSTMPDLSQKTKMFFALAPAIAIKYSPSPIVKLLAAVPESTVKSRIDVYLDHFPDRTSVKTLLHWKQMRESGLFRYFDYGAKNQAKYNQSYPPSYQVEDMVVPTAVWSGGEDLLSAPEDIKALLPQITNLVYHHSFSDWNHWTFTLGLDAPKLLYFKIIQMMEKSLSNE